MAPTTRAPCSQRRRAPCAVLVSVACVFVLAASIPATTLALERCATKTYTDIVDNANGRECLEGIRNARTDDSNVQRACSAPSCQLMLLQVANATADCDLVDAKGKPLTQDVIFGKTYEDCDIIVAAASNSNLRSTSAAMPASSLPIVAAILALALGQLLV